MITDQNMMNFKQQGSLRQWIVPNCAVSTHLSTPVLDPHMLHSWLVVLLFCVGKITMLAVALGLLCKVRY